MDANMQAAGLPQAQAASNTDDRVWAALAHASALLMFVGPLIPLVIWTMQRKKSPYVAFHALQAMAYQALFFWAWLIVAPLLTIAILFAAIAVFTVVYPQAADQPFAVFGMQMLTFGVIIGAMLLFVAAGIVGAVACLAGREFRYPLFGGRLARYLEYQGPDGAQMPDDKQDYVVASVSHATCIIFFWGLVAPIVAWLTQHDRSPFLRFQALQAAIYQAIGLLVYVAMMAVYMVMMFGMMGAAFALESGGNGGSAAPAWLAAFMIPFLCIIGIFALGVPLYHLFGFIAALRTLRGNDYRYPVLGTLLASRMKPVEAK